MLPAPLLGPAVAAGRRLHSLYLACAQLPRCCGAGHSAGIRRNVGRYTAHTVSFSLSSILYGEVVNHCEQLHNLWLKNIFYRRRVKKSSISTPTNSVLIQHGAATRPHRLVPLVNNPDTGQQLVLDAGPLTYLGAGWLWYDIYLSPQQLYSSHHVFRQKMVYFIWSKMCISVVSGESE